MRLYEIFVILHPRLSEEEVNVFATSLEKKVADRTSGAAITGRKAEHDQSLAYPIKKQLRGHFLHLELEVSGEEEVSNETHQEMQLEQNVLRYLVFRKERKAPQKTAPATVIDRLRDRQKKYSTPTAPAAENATLDTNIAKESELDTEEVDKKIEELLT